VSDGADPADVIAWLGLEPHPEGGHYRETFRHAPEGEERGVMTAILYLLQQGDVSGVAPRRRDGDLALPRRCAARALDLRGWPTTVEHRLGPNLLAGAQPEIAVPADAWQSARSTGAWPLAGCTVGPAFEFEGFELAPPGWEPGA
jgi:predicted cupin superfamily sugar epimerase